MQVRETRKGTDALKGIKDNMLLALTNLMDRLDVVYAGSAANAPKAFDERINFGIASAACVLILRIGCTRFALGRV